MRTTVDVPVLIVGGGPVGLLTALGLRHFGVECTVVEKHVSTLDFPKGRRVNTRRVEILRQRLDSTPARYPPTATTHIARNCGACHRSVCLPNSKISERTTGPTSRIVPTCSGGFPYEAGDAAVRSAQSPGRHNRR
jgi:2-polyprenyl-6-methoxyphenol hydroxylase-like FAD-dependent oxidoreductase